MPDNTINVQILSKLLQSGVNFISGNDLAKSLDTSRVSIWAHFNTLRQEGFEFEAIQNKGYRIKSTPGELHADLIKAYLHNSNIDLPIIYLPEVDSTNTEAERHLADNHPTPFAVISSKQTAGRGRHGRSWLSENEGNTYISFAFKPNISPELVNPFTPWVATQLCHHLSQIYDIPLQLKWPNDLLIKGKKVCGMLAESRVDFDHTRDLIFGIGTNINSDPKSWPKELQKTATSLKAACSKAFNINEFAANILATILNAYNEFINNNWKDKLQELWPTYDVLYNKEVHGFHGTIPINGVAKGIANDGALKLLLPDGTLKLLHAGELSLSSPITNVKQTT